MTARCRANASRVVAATISRGQSLADTLPPALDNSDADDRALLQQLSYGTLREAPRLLAILDLLLQRPLR